MFINRKDDDEKDDKKDDDKKDSGILNLSHLKDCPYLSGSVDTYIPDVFLKSNSYTSILNEVSNWKTNSEIHKPVKICGPKGTGKTLCLLALMSEPKIVSSLKPVFLSYKSFQENKLRRTKEYLGKVSNEINFEETGPIEDTTMYLMKLVRTQKVMLFMDFDYLDDTKIVGTMCEVATFCKFAVLAMSSGDGHDTDCRSINSINQKFKTLQHFPFTEGELDRFIKLNKIKFSKEQLLPLTGYNPFLLSLATTATDENDLMRKINHYMLRFISNNLKMSTTLPIQFIKSLKLSEKYLWMAFNNSNPIDNIQEFDSSWVGQNKICFLRDRRVEINFPKLPQLLKQDVRRIVCDHRFDISTHPQVKGYLIEEMFFEYAGGKNIVVESASNCISFKVNQVQTLDLDQATLTIDVLYRLRAYHPVIDAVGRFSQESGGDVLAYFQISISSYTDHSTKIANLFEKNCGKKGYSELTDDCPTINQYYKRKASITNPTVYYVYISTTTTTSNCTRLSNDADGHRIRYGVLSAQSDLYIHLKAS